MRGLEVFGLFGSGLGTEIATRLGLSAKTVETHRAHLKEKLGFERSSELLVAAARWVRDGQTPPTTPRGTRDLTHRRARGPACLSGFDKHEKRRHRWMALPSPHGGGVHRCPLDQPPDAAAKDKILTRLRSAEGHLRGVVQMVEDDGYCIDVLRQTKAIHAALAKVETLLLNRHLHHCVTRAVRSDKPQNRARVIAELLDIYEAKRGNGR